MLRSIFREHEQGAALGVSTGLLYNNRPLQPVLLDSNREQIFIWIRNKECPSGDIKEPDKSVNIFA